MAGTRFVLKAVAAAVLLVTSVGASAAADEAVVVGGVTPSVRPAGMPAIRGIQNGTDWYRHALTGVSQPYPKSLFFLDNQGGWYTPFSHPGMLERYDLRGWHAGH